MSDISLSETQLRQLMADAAEEGANKALARVGLHDEQAARDVYDLRSLLLSWRRAKGDIVSEARKLVVRVILVAILALVGLRAIKG